MVDSNHVKQYFIRFEAIQLAQELGITSPHKRLMESSLPEHHLSIQLR